MKMKRADFKALVKECLVEILADGLGTNLNEAIAARPALKPRSDGSAGSSSRSIYETIAFSKQRQGPPPLPRPSAHNSPVMTEAIKSVSGGDSVLSTIFADTAKTTLTQQSGADRPNATAPADAAAAAVAQHSPEDIFGDAAGKWAALAFSDSPQKSG